MKTPPLILLCWLTLTAAATAQMREWTFQKNGKTIEGEVIGFSGEAVNLKRADGKTVLVPLAYLTASNRVDLLAQRTAQWKEIEVLKVVAAVSAGGRYKKCEVAGEGVPGTVLLELLPPSVESMVNTQSREADRIAALTADADKRKRALQRMTDYTPQGTANDLTYGQILQSHYETVKRLQGELGTVEENLLAAQTAHSVTVSNTLVARTLKIKSTGALYDGCPVWRCADPRRPEP